MKIIFTLFLSIFLSFSLLFQEKSFAQKDSTTAKAKPEYEKVSGFHRFIFGENFRKEWAAPTKLKVIKISEIKGGLIPVERGGRASNTFTEIKR